MACMAQEYHGDGDVDGSLCKISNMGVTDVNERTACLRVKGNGGPRGDEGKGKDDVMVTWGSPFVPVAFKTLGLFNSFPAISQKIF